MMVSWRCLQVRTYRVMVIDIMAVDRAQSCLGKMGMRLRWHIHRPRLGLRYPDCRPLIAMANRNRDRNQRTRAEPSQWRAGGKSYTLLEL